MTPVARAVAMMALLLALVVAAPAVAAAPDPEVQKLADRHAPVVMLKDQEEACDPDGEQYAPTAVDVVLDNPQVFLRQVGTDNPVLMNGAGASDLFDLGEGFYLDFPGSALAPGCIYEEDFQRYSEGRRAVVYAHLAVQQDQPDRLALQYWFYWYFNDWNNKHEGDWEGIQLLFDVGTVEEALLTEPVSVGYAQHSGGERADWDDDKLERRGARPVVYPSAGSHASYFGSALYLGRSGSEGFGCDITEGPSTAVEPEVVVLPDAVDDPDDPLAWLAFEGRWGERQSGPFNGPTGPAAKDRWTAPIAWHDDLRSSSVAVPGDNLAGSSVINAFCGVVEWGSAQLILLKEQPAFVLIAVVVAFALLSFAFRRTDWTPVRPLPIARLRRAGQIIKAAARLYREYPIRFLEIAISYVPVALVVGLGVYLLEQLPVIGSLIESDSDLGAVSVSFGILVGSLSHALGFAIAVAATAVMMRGLEEGRQVRGRDAFRQTYLRIGDLLAAFVRATIIVGVLIVSVVGLPWGVRQLVRYQFLSQATVLEGLGGQAALDRSSQLVRGRWLHTALVIVLLNALVALVSGVVGLLILLALTGVPLWLFSLVVSAFGALVVPYSAIAYVLLYGNAVADLEGLDPAEPLGEPDTRAREAPAARR
jgi:hypothetical protein